MIGTPTNACVLYDARVWSTTLVWSTHVPRLNVHLYVATVTVTLFACISIHLRRLAFTSSPSLLFLSDVTAGRAELAKCLMRILSVVLQQLVSAGKPSFAAILATNPPTSHPSLLPYFRSGFQDSSFEALSNWLGHFARCFPQPVCSHFEEEMCYSSPTLFFVQPVIGVSINACVLYDARVWSTTPLWSNHVPRLHVHLYFRTVPAPCSPVYNTITSNGIYNAKS